MDRRNFLRAAILAGAAFTVKRSGAMTVLSQNMNAAPAASGAGRFDMVAVMGGEPAAMFRKAITEMGGMGLYVKKGQKVCIKPNIG